MSRSPILWYMSQVSLLDCEIPSSAGPKLTSDLDREAARVPQPYPRPATVQQTPAARPRTGPPAARTPAGSGGAAARAAAGLRNETPEKVWCLGRLHKKKKREWPASTGDATFRVLKFERMWIFSLLKTHILF